VIHRTATLAIVLLLAPFLAPAQDGPPTYLLINNATVWDGTSDAAAPGMNVLVENNLIKQISAEPIPFNPSANTTVIDGGGVSGKVSHMSLVSTTFMTFDNQKLVVPNNSIWGGSDHQCYGPTHAAS